MNTRLYPIVPVVLVSALAFNGIVAGSGGTERVKAGAGSVGVSSFAAAAEQAVTMEDVDMLRITTLYDNYEYSEELRANWGFSCLVGLGDNVILFDTGGDSPTLRHNLDELGLDLTRVQALVLSHDHGDHTGGLQAVLERVSGLKVYVCHSFTSRTRREVEGYGGKVVDVAGPVEIAPGIHSTGELGTAIHEQSLVVDTGKGTVVITGCAHPGVVGIVRKAKQIARGDVLLLMGGFHLMGAPESVVTRAIADLKELGVQKVSPTHCTGDAAIDQFREAFGENFLLGGVGLVVEFPLAKAS